MSSKLETIFTKSHILTMNTLIYSLTRTNLLKSTSITVVVELLPHLLINDLFLENVLFFFDLAYNIWVLLVSAQRAFDSRIVLQFVFSPLTEAFKVECVPADSRT